MDSKTLVSYRGFFIEPTENDRFADPGFSGFWIYKADRLDNPWGHGETIKECEEICDREICEYKEWILEVARYLNDEQ